MYQARSGYDAMGLTVKDINDKLHAWPLSFNVAEKHSYLLPSGGIGAAMTSPLFEAHLVIHWTREDCELQPQLQPQSQ